MVPINKKYLTINKWSRPGRKLIAVKGFVIHWEANPNTSALANWRYFENRKYGNTGFGAAQYIMDPDGSVIQCMPDWELAYQVGSETYLKAALRRLSSYPNNCVIGIELPHIDWDGRMTSTVYDSAVKFTAMKLKEHKLSTSNIWLHQEIVGWKDCHRWFVNNPSAWKRFKQDVAKVMRGGHVSSNKGYLEKGDRGSKVKELQQDLIKLGYKLPKFGADSHFGNETDKALRKFQRDNNLKDDGLFGKNTEKVMDKLLEGGLTVKEVEKLQRQINQLNKRLDEKMETTSSSKEPNDSHAESWKWLVDEGISNGATPRHYITREQVGSLLYQFANKNEKLPEWMYDAIVDQFEGLAPYLQKPDEWKEKLQNHEVSVNELLGVFILAFLNKETADKEKEEPAKEN